MIRISDKNNLLIEMFGIYADQLQKVVPAQAQVEVLGTYDIAAEASDRPTVIVCTEPTIDRAHEVFAPLIQKRPNCLWAVTHEKTGFQYRVPRSIFFPSNLCLTVRANDQSNRWTANTKPYLACALLGGWGQQRIHLYHALKKTGLRDRCLINFRRRNISNIGPESLARFDDYQSPQIPELDDPRFQSGAYVQGGINTMRPISFENRDATWISQIVPWRLYDHCYINLVAETSTDSFLPSEKIGKPLLAGQPWIAFSCQGFLEKLRQLGFRTFHPFIDETYDSLESVKERAQAAVASLMDFERLSDRQKLDLMLQIQPILDHNRALMLDLRHWYDPLARAIIDLAA